MTKIYIYCLFDMDSFMGVYSSLKSVHRDALRLANRGRLPVYMWGNDGRLPPSLTGLRNFFKGKCDIEIKYRSDTTAISIYKTKLKE